MRKTLKVSNRVIGVMFVAAMADRVQNEPHEQNQQNQQLQAKVDVLTQVLASIVRLN